MSDAPEAWEARFTLSCSQCGGEDFSEVFPVPAEIFRAYLRCSRLEPGRELVASVYACRQCGHLERFVDPAELPPQPG